MVNITWKETEDKKEIEKEEELEVQIVKCMMLHVDRTVLFWLLPKTVSPTHTSRTGRFLLVTFIQLSEIFFSWMYAY